MAGKAILLVLLGCLATSSQAGVVPSDPRIVNGVPAGLGEIPYQVALTSFGSLFCGGSLLNRNYVITAAHCVSSKSPGSVVVYVGTVDLKNPQITRKVSKIIVHEKYAPGDSWKNDIALLKLANPVDVTTNVNYVTLPKPGFTVTANEKAVVSGWGRLTMGGQLPRYLQKASIFIASETYCSDIYRPSGYNIYNSHICAYDASTNRGSCHGDSGGPLTVQGKLVGLVSWANGCASTTYPTVYTRVSSFIDWIQKHAV